MAGSLHPLLVAWLGLWLTAVAVVLCSTLLAVQLHAFMQNEGSSRLEIDTDQSEMVRVKFDVTISDLACSFATVGAFDAFGNVRSNLTRDIQKQPLDHLGADKGHPYSDEELTELEFADRPQLTAEERAQLDSDWLAVASKDNFQAGDFHSALEAHDFVFVLFCISNAGPCLMMLPAWLRFAEKVNNGNLVLKDANGERADVWALQVNCAPDAFMDLCKEEGLRGFPQVRLYPRSVARKATHRDIAFAFPMPVMLMAQLGVRVQMAEEMLTQIVGALEGMAAQTVQEKHLHTNVSAHEIFREGCRLTGHIDVPRVPGTLHIEAKSASDHVLNTAFTNMSHTIHHLSFSRPGDESEDRLGKLAQLPGDYGWHAEPLSGMSFSSSHFHQGAHHYLKVMHTRLEGDENVRLYLYMNQWYMQTYPRHESPKMKISYDVSPLEVVLSHRRHWYDFATSTLALVGGAYSFVQITYLIVGGLSAISLNPKRKVGVI
eukprot:TRINITY_DN34516_c0_g1_i2.p1 TRINITY_DN34516_c0_g1~~TRINITY_DN34516_c0_g1_i2.p1  ORF type:complete len:489 (-),score=91.26 TRINITY_DN34516_c0_g1_i2:69-1535(-)